MMFCVGEGVLFIFLVMLLAWLIEGGDLTTFPFFLIEKGEGLSNFLAIVFASEVGISFVITAIATGWWLVKGIRLIKTKK